MKITAAERAMVDQANAAFRDSGPVSVRMPMIAWGLVVANLRLAARHPGNTGPSARALQKVIADLEQLLPPEVVRMLAAGDRRDGKS